MPVQNLKDICEKHLQTLVAEIGERPVGSPGNREAEVYVSGEINKQGWDVHVGPFDALDWIDRGSELVVGGEQFKVNTSPYSKGCRTEALTTSVSSVEDLRQIDLENKIVLLHGEIASEQLMPKNFVFYNPEEHKTIVALLEESEAKAFVCATARNAPQAGGVYPFPLIEDGDFHVPSVYMTEEEGRRLLNYVGQKARLESRSILIPSAGSNVVGRKGEPGKDRIVISAHLDTKKGTPGALDNATGVTILLLLASAMRGYDGDKMIELVAFNGEDYYSAPGQMHYIAANEGLFETIALNINIDGAGYKIGNTAYSFYGLPDSAAIAANSVFSNYPGLVEGPRWSQGDHGIFIQKGCPAIAITSRWFIDNIERQDITHTPKDKIDLVCCSKLVEITEALARFITVFQP